MIIVKNLTKKYGNKKVLDDVSLNINKGKITSFIGPNGAGKSTLLSIISRLLKKDSGQVIIENKELSEWDNNDLAKKISILRQSNNINIRLTIRELVSFGRFPYSKGVLKDDDISIVNYVKKLIAGDKVIFRIPITDLVLKDNNNDKVFIASGTGIVPFISMVDQLTKQKFTGNVTVIFGCLNDADNFISKYFDEYKDSTNIKIHIFIENLGENDKQLSDYYNILLGRVTQMFTADKFDYKNTDFYLCGHPNMVNATIELIRQFGGNNIYY